MDDSAQSYDGLVRKTQTLISCDTLDQNFLPIFEQNFLANFASGF